MAADLEVGIGVDLKELTEGLKKVSSQLTEFSTKTKSDAEKAGNSWSDGFEKMVKGYITFEAVTRVGGAAKNLLLLEERFNALKMPLANVTQATGDYGLALGFITRLADQTGQDLFVLGDSYKNLYASAKQAGFATDEINKIFGSVVRAGSALKLSNEQVSLSLKAVEQMMNKGTISSEELKGQLGEQLPGAYGIMAKAAQDAGISVSGSTQELGKLLEQGKVGSAQVLPFFAKRMEEAFGKNANANINTISGSANRMKNELTLLVSALDDSKVTSFWASIQNGIANTMKDLTFLIKSGSWQDFMEWTKGSVMVTGKRIGMEMQDQNFASKSKIEQIKEYNELNKDLLWHMNMVDKAARSGGHPVTDQVSKLADQVKRYKAIMGGGGANGKSTIPPLVGKDEIKDVQDYTFEIKLLEQETKTSLSNIQTYWEDIFRSQNAVLGGMDIKKVSSLKDSRTKQASLGAALIDSFDETSMGDFLDNTTKRLSEKAGLLGERITKAFKEGLTKKEDNIFGEWILSLNEDFGGVWDGLKTTSFKNIESFTNFFRDKFSMGMGEAIQSVNQVIQIGANLISDTFTAAFTSIFDKDVKFSFKNVLGNFLKAFGAFVTQIGQRLLAAGVLLALVPETAALGARRIAAGVGLMALGSAMGAAGGSMASDSVSTTTGSNTTTNARSYSPYGGNGYDSMQTVEVRFANGALKGYIDNRDKKYNG